MPRKVSIARALAHKNPWWISRSQQRQWLKDVSRYALQTGQVIAAWNDLQGEYQRWFIRLANEEKAPIGAALWHTLSNDQTQRDLLEAVLEVAPLGFGRKNARLKTNLLWALKETRRLARYRNFAAHLPVDVEYAAGQRRVVPDAKTAKPTAIRALSFIGHRRLFRLLRGDLFVLASYVSAHYAVRFEISPGVFPNRPRLHTDEAVRKSVSQRGRRDCILDKASSGYYVERHRRFPCRSL